MVTTNIPMSGRDFINSCKRWGLTVVEHAGWENRNRNGDGRAWGPINGFVVHNFASDISDVSSIDYLIRGDNARGMPGPLSQLALDDLGRVHIIGWGRANHVGTGDPVILDRVIRDDVPLTGEMRVTPRHNAVSCTHRFVGVEMLYGKAPTAAQRAALPKLCAAFLSVMGWAATSVIGHREISMSKAADGVFRADRSDPVGFDMDTVRRQVQALLRSGPGSTLSNPVGTLPVPSNPKPVPEEDIMASIDDLRRVIREELDSVPPPDSWPAKLRESNPKWTVGYSLYNLEKLVSALQDPARLAKAVVDALPSGERVTQDTVEAALRNVLGSLAPEPPSAD